jgi:hypothetical protein
LWKKKCLVVCCWFSLTEKSFKNFPIKITWSFNPRLISETYNAKSSENLQPTSYFKNTSEQLQKKAIRRRHRGIISSSTTNSRHQSPVNIFPIIVEIIIIWYTAAARFFVLLQGKPVLVACSITIVPVFAPPF